MVLHAPGIKPKDYGMKNGDYHLVVNATTKTLKAYNFQGVLQFEIPCLAEGEHPNFREPRGDTPPGLYELGACYPDFQTYNYQPPYNSDIMSYGWGFFDLKDLGSPDGEDINGRSGVGIHGGGTGLGFPNCWAEYQSLLYTWGCLRVHNYDWFYKIYPLKTNKNRVFVSVYQDDV